MEENKGGLSMFGMDFASKGFSWAGNLYQKWENICRENITTQDPSKFVDLVSEQFRKICEEVADDWLNPFSDGCAKGPVSDLSLEQDVISEICKKSKIGHDESHINEGSLISISSEEDTVIAPWPVVGQDVREEACEMHSKKVTITPAEVKRWGCSSEIHEEVSPNFVNLPGSLSSADEVLLSEFTENIAERGFRPSNWTSSSEEAISWVQSTARANEQKSNSSEPELPLSPTELGEPFIDGKAVPYDPKYHEEWVRNNARANERSRRNDRPRNFDRSRNFERRRENMQNRDFQNRVTSPMPNQQFQSSEVQNPMPPRDMPPGPGTRNVIPPVPPPGNMPPNSGGMPGSMPQNVPNPNRGVGAFPNPSFQGTPNRDYQNHGPGYQGNYAPNRDGGNLPGTNAYQGAASGNVHQGGGGPYQGGGNAYQGGGSSAPQGAGIAYQGGGGSAPQGAGNTYQGGGGSAPQAAGNTYQGGGGSYQGSGTGYQGGSGGTNPGGGNVYQGGSGGAYPGGGSMYQGGGGPYQGGSNGYQGGLGGGYPGGGNAYQGGGGGGGSGSFQSGGNPYQGRDMPGRD